MAKYTSGEPMYQCGSKNCKLWFSDREGVKVAMDMTDSPNTLTHIGCPKCDQGAHPAVLAMQQRHEECIGYG